MARSNKEGQGQRNKSGTAFQRKVRDDFEVFLEAEELDDMFEVINLVRQPTILSNGKSVSPDVLIVNKASKEVVVRIGCKTSLRERWKEDDRDAIWCGSDIPWVEMTERERPSSSLESIRRKCAKVKKESNFTFVASMLDPDGMNVVRKSLKNTLVSTSSTLSIEDYTATITVHSGMLRVINEKETIL